MRSPSNLVPPAVLGVAPIVAICVANHTALTGSRVAVSLVALGLGISTFQVGLLLAVYALMPTLGAVWLGRWMDRIGSRLPALAGMSAICAGLVLAASWPSAVTLLLTAALVGAGYSASVLALQGHLADLPDPAQRNRGFSAFALGTAVSSGLGPLLAGAGLTRLGARPTFALQAAIALVALLASVALRDRLVSRGEHPFTTIRTRSSLRDVLASRPIRRVLLADLLMAIAWNSNTFVLPIYGTQRGWSSETIGKMLATFGGAVLLVRAVPATWRRSLDDWAAIRLALASSGLCFVLFPHAARMPTPLVLEAILGLGLGGALSSVLVLLHEEAPKRMAGEVLGLRLVVLNGSAIALPVLLGGLAASVGLGGFMWVTGSGLVASAVAMRRASFRGALTGKIPVSHSASKR